MYLVIKKSTQELIHSNPAPLSQKLTGKQVYHKFSGQSMEIIETNLRYVPANLQIDNGQIVVKGETLLEKVQSGQISLLPHQKIVNNEVVEKTLREKVKGGIVYLAPDEKIVGTGSDSIIEKKTIQEQVDEGILELQPNQRVKGNKIVDKTIAEQIKDGLIEIDVPFEKLSEDTIVNVEVAELLSNNLISSLEICKRAIATHNRHLEREIRSVVSMGTEMKKTKDYLNWVLDDKPEGDERVLVYSKMQLQIQEIKNSYAEIKTQLEEKLRSF